MFLDYDLDIEKNSIWKIAAPVMDAKEFPFSVNEIGLFYARQRYFTERSGKKDHLLLFTVAGVGELTYLGRIWRLEPGSVCLIDCEKPHNYRTSQGDHGTWTFYWMHVSTRYGARYYELLNGRDFQVLKTDMDAELIDYFLRALALMDYATSSSGCQLSHCVSGMLSDLIAQCQSSQRSPTQDLTVQQAIKYLKQHFDKSLDLDELTHELGISKYYFIRLFSKHTGVTPYQYLILQRVVKAKQLLRTTDSKVGEIGREVGFQDESNFCRTFRRLTGMPPSEYRKKD